MALKDKISRIKEKFKSSKEVFKGNKSLDKKYSARKSFDSEAEAKKAFEDAKKRLYDVNLWSSIGGPENARFTLYNQQKNPSNKTQPSIGDFIKIELPGPFPENWVEVVDLKEDLNFAEFTVKPSYDPTNKEQSKAVTEHFFRRKASSTFKVELKGKSLIAYEIGKQEAINKKGIEAGHRSAVNTVIAEGGWTAFQKIQWENFTQYVVGNKK